MTVFGFTWNDSEHFVVLYILFFSCKRFKETIKTIFSLVIIGCFYKFPNIVNFFFVILDKCMIIVNDDIIWINGRYKNPNKFEMEFQNSKEFLNIIFKIFVWFDNLFICCYQICYLFLNFEERRKNSLSLKREKKTSTFFK